MRRVVGFILVVSVVFSAGAVDGTSGDSTSKPFLQNDERALMQSHEKQSTEYGVEVIGVEESEDMVAKPMTSLAAANPADALLNDFDHFGLPHRAITRTFWVRR